MTQAIPKSAVELTVELNSGVQQVSFPPEELWSDEPPLESDLHRDQIDLLIRLMRSIFQPGGLAGRDDVYVAGNLTVFYSPNQKKSEYFRGPDLFVVMGTDPRPRRSWTVWQENGQYPNVIIELLSDSTAAVDRNEKKGIYQAVWRVPEYFWFDPDDFEFQGFRLVNGQYQPIEPNSQGYLWSQELGFYLGLHYRQLRLFQADGSLVPLPEEAATQRANEAERRANQAERKAADLAAKLRELGIDPESV
jgi:Uma2 family endonuclease